MVVRAAARRASNGSCIAESLHRCPAGRRVGKQVVFGWQSTTTNPADATNVLAFDGGFTDLTTLHKKLDVAVAVAAAYDWPTSVAQNPADLIAPHCPQSDCYGTRGLLLSKAFRFIRKARSLSTGCPVAYPEPTTARTREAAACRALGLRNERGQ